MANLQLTLLALNLLVDIHNRTLIHIPALNEEYNGGKDNDDAPHKDRPVHAGGSDLPVDWEETHDERKRDVQQGYNVAWDREAAETPARWWQRLAANALDEDAADGDEVGAEERRDEQRDDGVEGCGAADVDDGQDDRDAQG